MSIVRVDQQFGANWTSTLVTTAATPAINTPAGCFVICFQNDIPATAVLSDTAGNSYTLVNIDGTPNHFWYAKNALGNAANVITANWSGGVAFDYLAALTYTGVDPNNPIDTYANTPFGTQGAQNPFSPPINTRFPVEVLLSNVQSSDTTAGPGTGWTALMHPGANPELVQEKQVTTLQTGIQATATESTAAGWACNIVAVVGAGQPYISGNAGVGGATISWSGTASGSTVADALGNYNTGLLANGTYILTPSLTGYTFSPPTSVQVISGASIIGVNFTAIIIKSGGAPMISSLLPILKMRMVIAANQKNRNKGKHVR
jgi:hypothetical protein